MVWILSLILKNMSLLLKYRKIKTKKIKEKTVGKFSTDYKLIDVDNCDKIMLLKGYSFDKRISYFYCYNNLDETYRLK